MTARSEQKRTQSVVKSVINNGMPNQRKSHVPEMRHQNVIMFIARQNVVSDDNIRTATVTD